MFTPPHSAINTPQFEAAFEPMLMDWADLEWDAYVQELKEAKLRALGVTLGDEEPAPTISPAVSNVSRRTSMQYPPLPFSPPIPTSSAASSHVNAVNPFSPQILPGAGLSASQSSNPGSIASPASLQLHLQGKYNPRQSISLSGDHPFGSPFQYPQGQTHGFWSPQQMLQQQGHSRGGSPSIHNLGSIVSPTSPFQDGFFPPQPDTLAQLQQRQQLLQAQLQMYGSARASPRLQEVKETDDEQTEKAASKSPSKTPEASQAIRHNPSASLQKEIDEAEYHLEEQMQRQLEHDDYSPHPDNVGDENPMEAGIGQLDNHDIPTGFKGFAAPRLADDFDGPVLHHPQPHSRGHSLSQRPFQDGEESPSESKTALHRISECFNEVTKDQSDIETNPSNLGTPVPETRSSSHDRSVSMSSNPWLDSGASNTESSSAPRRSAHAPKASVSKLNVAAKEFKFDPTSAFKPGQFSFGTGNFQPTTVNYVPFNINGPVPATSSHFSHPSLGSSKSKINVAAPAFTPGQSDFSFSTSGPTFRPDAPSFTPAFTESVGSGSDGPRSSIFGNIDFSEIGKSKSKKSKAIPIVRPDSIHSRKVEDETMEGKDGRITQGEGRIKRARGGQDNGDSVPLFAEPSMPLGETNREQSPPKELQPAAKTVDKENADPDVEEGVDRPKMSASVLEKTPDSANKDWAPFEFQKPKHAEDFNAARPFTSRRYASGLPGYGYQAPHDEPAAPALVEEEDTEPPAKEEPKKGHKKTMSSLSATAKPFEFKPSAPSFTFGGSAQPIPAPAPAPAPAPFPKLGGLADSMFARSPSPPAEPSSPKATLQLHEVSTFQRALPQPESPPQYPVDVEPAQERELTFEEIDDVMRHMNETELSSARKDENEATPRWHQPSPTRQLQSVNHDQSSPIRLLPQHQHLMRSDAPSPSPRKFHPLPGDPSQRIFTRAPMEDPFVDRLQSASLFTPPVHHLNRAASPPASDWDDEFSESEDLKLQNRTRFFNGHVNDLVGGLLEQRLGPLEKTLETIQLSLETMTFSGPLSRRERDRRSVSGALSDADDEDDEGVPQRAMSPRRDRKLDKIRAIVAEALNAHESSGPQTAASMMANPASESQNVLKALEEMKEQFGASMRLDFRAEDLRNVVEEAVEKRMPASPKLEGGEAPAVNETEYRTRIAELEEKLRLTEETVEEEILKRRDAEDNRAETERLLNSSMEEETRLRHLAEDQISKVEDEVSNRRAAEDRLAEVQRLLRIATEEETRLRDAMEEREVKIREIVDAGDTRVRAAEEQRAKTAMHISLLEAAQDNASQSQADLANRLHATENDLLEARKQVHRLQSDTERAMEAARRHIDDAEVANDTNTQLRWNIESLRCQLEESTRLREGMRGKLMDLQEDMAKAAREITDENAHRAKREQELIARQEVLDAKLQAEARTRERLEMEIERLEKGEREGMRAAADCKRLEALVVELRMESHVAQKETLRYQREFEEARESGLTEVQRTRTYLEAELANANNQVNVVREDLEHQILRLRGELDHVKLQTDTAKAQHEMLLEEATTSKDGILMEMATKHANQLEDLQVQHERQLGNATEDAQRSEQHLLERLSLSTAKTEHLQDRVTHLEEKLEITKSAADAAAQAARTAGGSVSKASPVEAAPAATKALSRAMELPEKISPQALRESILVLQEQLQDREQKTEKLEHTLSTLDIDAPTKISKRDDEIMWLRELLSVRKGDLQDIITTLSRDDYDPNTLKDAAIRLRANLQMEEQERERALNGGSALTNLPNIAVSLRDAATPRVAQAVGPLAAAWGNWRKGRAAGEESTTAFTPARGSANANANANANSPSSSSTQSFLSGLLTPPTSSVCTPPTATAFNSTGTRFSSAQLANRPRAVVVGGSGGASKRAAATRSGSGKRERDEPPRTPPMLWKGSYDADAAARSSLVGDDFGSEEGFFDDDESALDGSGGGGVGEFGR